MSSLRIISPKDVSKLGTILSVWAHPDDETFTSAGIMAIAIKNDQNVVCVTATKGEDGSQDHEKWPPETIGSVREQELHKALEVIGIKDHYWLGYKDGHCENIDKNAAAKKVAKIIKKHQPDTILTFGKDGITGHSDHCCVSCWVDDAVELSGLKPQIYHAVHTIDQYENYLKYMDQELDIFFNIDEPPIYPEEDCDIYIKLSDQLKTTKLKALAQMPSQTEVMLRTFDAKFLSDALDSEAFVRAK